jgi:hypothetical protein
MNPSLDYSNALPFQNFIRRTGVKPLTSVEAGPVGDQFKKRFMSVALPSAQKALAMAPQQRTSFLLHP